MTLSLQFLVTTFPKAGVLIYGERDDLSILRQIVLKGTRGLRVFDVVLTNLAAFLKDPIIVPPI